MKIEIRVITPEDAEEINALSLQLGYTLSVEETRTQINRVISNKDHCALVAKTEDVRVIAWIHAFISLTIESKPFVEIGGLVVDENYRKIGIGKKLVSKIKEWTSEKDIHSLRVRSNIIRTETHKFYKSAGFTQLKEQKVFAVELNSIQK